MSMIPRPIVLPVTELSGALSQPIEVPTLPYFFRPGRLIVKGDTSGGVSILGFGKKGTPLHEFEIRPAHLFSEHSEGGGHPDLFHGKIWERGETWNLYVRGPAGKKFLAAIGGTIVMPEELPEGHPARPVEIPSDLDVAPPPTKDESRTRASLPGVSPELQARLMKAHGIDPVRPDAVEALAAAMKGPQAPVKAPNVAECDALMAEAGIDPNDPEALAKAALAATGA